MGPGVGLHLHLMKYMKEMPAASEPPADLIDLKFLPAWVREDAGASPYADFEGEQSSTSSERIEFGHGRRERGNRRDRPPRRDQRQPQRENRERDRRPGGRPPRDDRRSTAPRSPSAPVKLPAFEVHFLPESVALDNVIAQIKASTTAFSVYALARLFLQKPERYDVRVTSPAEQEPFYRLGESATISTDRPALENTAFRNLRDHFYRSDVTVNEPIKGNFTGVARERTTGTLLGPTSHHAYQPALRRLYDQRFSRRMSFADFQRQIENISDPALVEQWKEEARRSTTFTTLNEEAPRSFNTEAEAERHFRENYLPSQVTETREAVIDGVASRALRDRGLSRLIENGWAAEVRSPSHMMQELTAKLRGAGLQIFRHRRGMLFVSPVRPKPIDEGAVSTSVSRILEAIRATPRITRKDLAEKLTAGEVAPEEREKMRLSLAADLRFLVREGHVVEFNDATLDLPRVKPPASPPLPVAPAEAEQRENAPASVPVPEETPALSTPDRDEDQSPTTLS